MTSNPIHLRAPLFSATTAAANTTTSTSQTSPPSTLPPTSATADPKHPTLPSIPQILGKWHVTHSTLPMWKDKRNVTITYDLLPPVTVDVGENNHQKTDEKEGAGEDNHGNGSGSGSAGGNGKIDAHSSRAPAASAGSVARRTVELARLDDTVRYQKKRSKGGSGWGSGGGSVSTVRGIDRAVRTRTSATSVSESEAMRWRWKGTGWVTRWFSSQWEVLGFGDEGGDEDGNGDRTGDGAGDGDNDDGRNYWLVTYFSKTLVTPAGIDILSRRAGGPAEETVRRIRDALREQVPDEGVRRLEGMLFAVESEDLG